MSFDKEQFAELLEKAKGDRSINKYASEIDLSPAHISRLLRKLLETPPSPETISKLAQGAYNGVTYDSFMIAAGHINDSEDEVPTDTKNLSVEKKFHQTLTPYLFSLGNIKSINPPNKDMNLFDLIIELNDGIYSKWYIEFKHAITKSTFLNFLGKLTLYHFNSDEKIIIAVTNQKDYDILLNNKPQALNANLYVMLIDLNCLEVIKEEVLCQR